MEAETGEGGMRKYQIEIPAGKLFIVSTGEYSDYSVSGLFRAKAELKPDDLLEEYLTQHPEERDGYNADFDRFVAWLTGRGLIEGVEHAEWHLGSYGNWGE
jgi:hypothetical protein